MGKIQVNIGGAIRDLKKAQANIGGVIKPIKKVQVNIGGVIKNIWQNIGENVFYYRGYEGCPIAFSTSGYAGFANYTKNTDNVRVYGTAYNIGGRNRREGLANMRFRVDLTNIESLVVNFNSYFATNQLVYFTIQTTTGTLIKSFGINLGTPGHVYESDEYMFEVADVNGIVDIDFQARGQYTSNEESGNVTLSNEYRTVYSLIGLTPSDVITKVTNIGIGVSTYSTGLMDMSGLLLMVFTIVGRGTYRIVKQDGGVLYSQSFDTSDKEGFSYREITITLTKTALEKNGLLGMCKFEVVGAVVETRLQNLKFYTATLPN